MRHLRSLAVASLASGLLALLPGRMVAQGAATPEAALDAFMQAVADSNLSRMATLWGTEKGSAAKTKSPPDYERRLIITHAFLRGAKHRLAATHTAAGNSGSRRELTVEFSRNGCSRLAQVRAVQSKEGWLVNFVDLDAIGVPGRSCDQDEATRPAADSPGR